MKSAIVIYPTRGQGFAYAISFPKELVDRFKALFSHQDDRDWQEPVWCFKRVHLPAVQAWAVQCAEELHLELHDVTGMAKVRREQALGKIWHQEYEEHIAAMIEVLPKLPPRSLFLAHWYPTHLVIDLQTFLGKPIFEELKQAALPAGKVARTKEYIPMQGSHDVRLYAAVDPRILQALLPLQIKNFQTLNLNSVQVFENGTAHFVDQDGKLWFGAVYAQLANNPFDLHMTSLPYSIAALGESLYRVVQADVYVERYCLQGPLSSTSPDVARGVTFASLIEHYSLAFWFRNHITSLLAATEELLVSPAYSTHSDLWRSPSLWRHPAEFLFHFLSHTDPTPLFQLLEWDEAYFHQAQKEIELMKVRRAKSYYTYCREHAVELMQEKLHSLQRADIQELAARYGVNIPLWLKEKMIRKCTDSRMAEDLIGVTEERQTQTKGAIAFTDGIIWGKRATSDLYSALYRGYLSDGQRAISGLKIDTHWTWYALWEDWSTKKEKDRGSSVHSVLEREGIQDLAQWRWFVYHSEEEHPIDKQKNSTPVL